MMIDLCFVQHHVVQNHLGHENVHMKSSKEIIKKTNNVFRREELCCYKSAHTQRASVEYHAEDSYC